MLSANHDTSASALLKPSPQNNLSAGTTGLGILLEGFPGSQVRRWRHGEELQENAPRYESVIVDEKAEDKADPEHEDAE